MHTYPSEMAQNFWTAIFAWSTCFLATIAISLMTRAHDEATLVGLVHSLTPKPQEPGGAPWLRPAAVGGVVLLGAPALNLIYR